MVMGGMGKGGRLFHEGASEIVDLALFIKATDGAYHAMCLPGFCIEDLSLGHLSQGAIDNLPDVVIAFTPSRTRLLRINFRPYRPQTIVAAQPNAHALLPDNGWEKK